VSVLSDSRPGSFTPLLCKRLGGTRNHLDAVVVHTSDQPILIQIDLSRELLGAVYIVFIFVLKLHILPSPRPTMPKLFYRLW
jgi:hypothetical protein